MRKRWTAAALFVALFLPISAFGYVEIAFDKSGGGGSFSGSTLLISPEDSSFEIDVFLKTDREDVTGASIELTSEDSSPSEVAGLVSFTFDYPGTSGQGGIPGGVGTLTFGDYPATFPSGETLIGELIVDTTVIGLGPGGTITLTGNQWIIDPFDFDTYSDFTNDGATLAVVTPEPGSLALAIAGLTALAVCRRWSV